MKKVATVVMAALLLTVGGVYATYNYAQGSVESKDSSLAKSIADKIVSYAKGTISIDNTFKIKIDNLDGDNTTGFKTEGAFKVRFTPAPFADHDVTIGSVNLKLVIAFEGPNKDHFNRDIFKTTATYTTGGVTLDGNDVLNTDYDVHLENYITVNKVSLPTVSDYDQYVAKLNATSIKVTVSEA